MRRVGRFGSEPGGVREGEELAFLESRAEVARAVRLGGVLVALQLGYELPLPVEARRVFAHVPLGLLERRLEHRIMGGLGLGRGSRGSLQAREEFH